MNDKEIEEIDREVLERLTKFADQREYYDARTYKAIIEARTVLGYDDPKPQHMPWMAEWGEHPDVR